MTPWLILGGYLTAAVITARITLAVMFRDQGSLDDGDRFEAGVVGAIWPLIALFGALWLTGRYFLKPLTTPAAARRAAQSAAHEEADRCARAEAAAHNLPYPTPPSPDGSTR
jgi:hypothetical protein